jgi:hypothetical protein
MKCWNSALIWCTRFERNYSCVYMWWEQWKYVCVLSTQVITKIDGFLSLHSSWNGNVFLFCSFFCLISLSHLFYDQTLRVLVLCFPLLYRYLYSTLIINTRDPLFQICDLLLVILILVNDGERVEIPFLLAL